MIRTTDEQFVEVRRDMRGGKGEVTIRHYFSGDEIKAPCRLCSELILPPGTGIGLHEHNEEDEVFIIQQGEGVITEDESEVEVKKGDAILTGNGGSHAIRNTGERDLVVTAIIMKY